MLFALFKSEYVYSAVIKDTVYDILQTPTPERMRSLERLIEFATHEPHPNAANYKNLINHLKDYNSFTVLEREGNPVAFSGLWNPNIYSPHCARALTRTYYHPTVRNNSPLSGQTVRREGVVNIAIHRFLPWHVQKAKEMNLKAIFISFQGGDRRRAAAAVRRWIQQLYPEQDWQLLPHLYNTCRQVPHATNDPVNRDLKCWQNIIIFRFDKTFVFNQPSLTLEEWNKAYATSECSSQNRPPTNPASQLCSHGQTSSSDS